MADSISLGYTQTAVFYTIFLKFLRICIQTKVNKACGKKKCSVLLKQVVKITNLFELLKPIALRKAKIVYNFGLSECNRVKMSFQSKLHFHN